MRIDIWPAPDGWPLRQFVWPAEAAARGSLLFFNGRGDFLEKYLESANHWHSHGWNVAGFDWRGQGGSGRIVQRDADRLPLFERLLDDADAYVRGWMGETPGPHVLIGHSMGGHLLLRLLAERQVAPTAAVLVAPMLGLNSAPLPPALGRWVARLLSRLGLADRPVWKEDARHAPDRQRRLTACRDRFEDAAWWKAEKPELGLGAPHWGWFESAYESIAQLAKPGLIEAVRTPCLLVGTEGDRLVCASAIRRIAARLPDARLVMFATPGHEILRESDETRLAAFAAIDAFLDERAPRR